MANRLPPPQFGLVALWNPKPRLDRLSTGAARVPLLLMVPLVNVKCVTWVP